MNQLIVLDKIKKKQALDLIVLAKKKKKEIMEKWKNKWCQKTEYAWVIPVSKRKWEGLAFFTFHVITSAYEVVM